MRRTPSVGSSPAVVRHYIWLTCKFRDEIAVQFVYDSIGSYHQPRSCQALPTLRHAWRSDRESNGTWTCVGFDAYPCYCDIEGKRIPDGRDAAVVCTAPSCNSLARSSCPATLGLHSSNCVLYLKYSVLHWLLPQHSRQFAVLPAPWCHKLVAADRSFHERTRSVVHSWYKIRASQYL